MKIYSAHGINEFVICCGYKGYQIKEYFANYFLHMSDVTFDIERNEMLVHERKAEAWRVTLVDTGDTTLTGGRLARVAPYLRDEREFCFTYGDGVADIDISKLLAFHRSHGRAATITAVQPPGATAPWSSLARQCAASWKNPGTAVVGSTGATLSLHPSASII